MTTGCTGDQKVSWKGVRGRHSTALKLSVLLPNLNMSQRDLQHKHTLACIGANNDKSSTRAQQLNVPSFSSMKKSEPGP